MDARILLRILLAVFALVMAAAALLYLRKRDLSLAGYAAWGALAICLPVLGPFLVITARPGGSARDGQLSLRELAEPK